MTTLTLTGVSGSHYTYEVYSRDQNDWRSDPGNYVFGHQDANGKWWLHYIGETENLKDRLPCHERWDEAARSGATHILAHLNHGGLFSRQAEERDLIAAYPNYMNVQHRAPVLGAGTESLLGLTRRYGIGSGGQ